MPHLIWIEARINPDSDPNELIAFALEDMIIEKGPEGVLGRVFGTENEVVGRWFHTFDGRLELKARGLGFGSKVSAIAWN